jgi:nucleotide-binding universal stress UspA family protein
MRIENVLIPIDFSPISRMALKYAVVLARTFRARLTLLHVVERTAALALAFPDETAQMEREHHEQSERMLTAMITTENQRALDVKTLVKSGNVEQQVSATIREEDTDLVIMGTHGRGFVGHYLIGSVTHKVLRNVDIPTVTVGHATRPPALNRILFPTDLSDISQHVLLWAVDLAQTTHAKLVAVHAVDVGVEGGAEAAVYLGEERVEEARAKLNQWRSEASTSQTDLETVVSEGPPADVILKTAEDKSADFILITKGTLLGSVAEYVIRNAHVPVLTIPLEQSKLEQHGEPRAA